MLLIQERICKFGNSDYKNIREELINMVLEIGATVQMIKNLSDMAVKAIDSIKSKDGDLLVSFDCEKSGVGRYYISIKIINISNRHLSTVGVAILDNGVLIPLMNDTAIAKDGEIDKNILKVNVCLSGEIGITTLNNSYDIDNTLVNMYFNIDGKEITTDVDLLSIIKLAIDI